MDVEVTTYEFKITPQLDAILAGKHWHEEDGSSWRRINENGEWRWQPLNWQAFGKGEPDSEMTDIPPGAFAVPRK